MDIKNIDLIIPEKYRCLYQDNNDKRFIVFYGGRGGAKSHSIAEFLIIKALQCTGVILCAREVQTSIRSSVYPLLKEKIYKLGLQNYLTPFSDHIESCTGSRIIFKGIRKDITTIKSIHNILYCWVEEAETVTKNTWDVLIPSIRGTHKTDKDFIAKIIVTFNPVEETSDTYKRFVLTNNDEILKTKVYYYDNPLLPEVARRDMERCKKEDYEAFRHVWLGEVWKRNDAQVFNNKWVVEEFDTPPVEEVRYQRYFLGSDWGFSQDPATLIRSFIGHDNCLYIDYEAYSAEIEIDQLADFYDLVPESRKHHIFADPSRPDLISHLKSKGFKIGPAIRSSKLITSNKYIEAGIDYFRKFHKIKIHPRCKNTITEFKFYSYKVDKDGTVLRIIIDKHNHAIDALRYAYCTYIGKKKIII